ncbi:hypothetical protein EX30DRAFT_39297 [Ascodesmis nigricans]|uniref:Uncharacterized protein n=1 Tax=Ascodesmis nigricans TaxID=341454 RepID=A0A4S2MW64_9PEZI|nr:hypothetical protein EX30DRAFT_39297 [Ascodesmis nigricans]
MEAFPLLRAITPLLTVPCGILTVLCPSLVAASSHPSSVLYPLSHLSLYSSATLRSLPLLVSLLLSSLLKLHLSHPAALWGYPQRLSAVRMRWRW